MTTLRQAAQQALEALECMIDDLMYKDHKRVIDISNVAITALKAALEQQAETPPEWPLIKNILAEYGLDAISFVADWKAAQQQAEPVQKLVAWGVFDGNLHDMFFTEEEAQEMVRLKGDGSTVAPLYTAPPKRPWLGLTPEEILDLFDRNNVYGSKWVEFARTVENKLKEKNRAN